MLNRLPTWCRGALFLAALMMSGVVFDGHAQTRIFDAHVDAQGRVLIRGLQLDGQRSARIRLDNVELPVCKACSSDQAVVAQIPASVRGGRLPMRFQANQYRRDFYVDLPPRQTSLHQQYAGLNANATRPLP